jgi:hypothetical protein
MSPGPGGGIRYAWTGRDSIRLKNAEGRKFLAGPGIAGRTVHSSGHSPGSIAQILDRGHAFTAEHAPQFMIPDGGLDET